MRPATSVVSTRMRLPPTTATSSRASMPWTSGVVTCETAAARRPRTGSRCGTARTARARRGREPSLAPSAGSARDRGAPTARTHVRMVDLVGAGTATPYAEVAAATKSRRASPPHGDRRQRWTGDAIVLSGLAAYAARPLVRRASSRAARPARPAPPGRPRSGRGLKPRSRRASERRRRLPGPEPCELVGIEREREEARRGRAGARRRHGQLQEPRPGALQAPRPSSANSRTVRHSPASVYVCVAAAGESSAAAQAAATSSTCAGHEQVVAAADDRNAAATRRPRDHIVDPLARGRARTPPAAARSSRRARSLGPAPPQRPSMRCTRRLSFDRARADEHEA